MTYVAEVMAHATQHKPTNQHKDFAHKESAEIHI